MQSDNPRPRLPEVKLHESTKERDLGESLAEFYSIIKATDLLEAAFSRDAIKDSEYSDACSRLITQFKNSERVLIRSGAFANAEEFFQQYQVDCPRAYERLIVSGVPATVMHSSADSRAESVLVAETVQAFITAMDAVKLGLKAIDEVHPLISDLTSALLKLHYLPLDFEGAVKMKGWLGRLNSMRAVDELSEDDIRQLLFDLESSYSAFHKMLGSRK